MWKWVGTAALWLTGPFAGWFSMNLLAYGLVSNLENYPPLWFTLSAGLFSIFWILAAVALALLHQGKARVIHITGCVISLILLAILGPIIFVVAGLIFSAI